MCSRLPSSVTLLTALATFAMAGCDNSDTARSPTGPDEPALTQQAPIPITSCGTVITQPGVYEMAVDFGGAIGGIICQHPGPIIDIRVSNVTVRGYSQGIGYGVDGHAGPCILAGVGVPGGVSRIRLIGFDLRMCSGGAIVFENVSSSVVEKSTIWFNYPFGIAITGSPALSRADTVRNVSFSDNSTAGITIASGGDFGDFVVSDNGFDNSSATSSCGIIMSGSHSVISRNTITGEGRCGFEVTGNRNTIVSNIVAVQDVGINVGGQRNVIGENRVRVGFMGIQEGGAYNTLRGNAVENGNFAIYASGSYGLVKGNTVQNAEYGISVGGSRIRVNGNKVLNSVEAGIRAENGPNVIAENTVLNTTGFDLQDDLACGVNTWRRNTFGTASAPCIQ